MIAFKTIIEKFDKQGEKTGWTYFVIPNEIAEKINPGVKKSYTVKGTLDKMAIKGVSLLPMGEGDFIMPLNGTMRKQLRKKQNDTLEVSLAVDKVGYELNEVLIECLKEDTIAWKKFTAFPRSHQNYYSKWVDAAKTDATIAKRIAMIIKSMHLGQDFGEMLRSNKSIR